MAAFSVLRIKKGKMPMPSSNEIQSFKSFLHTVLAVGCYDNKDHVIVLNSWGSSFGKNGCFYMPHKIYRLSGTMW